MKHDNQNPPHAEAASTEGERVSKEKMSGNQCKCPTCGEYFARVSTFDKHRHGDISARACLTPAEMAAKGWQLNAGGFWVRAPRVTVEHFPGGDIGVGSYAQTVQFRKESP